ncbi:hypothetical protein J6590_070703 [Homalodisca vitripennis]|nr:hypothetical protein J6590_070703 [Homalodisca vitripennis]
MTMTRHSTADDNNERRRLDCVSFTSRLLGSYSMTGGMRVRSGGVERVGAQSKVGE